MIDSIIFYDADSKVGTKLSALSDAKADAKISRFIVAKEEGGNEFNFSSVVPIEVITKEATYDAEGNRLTTREVANGFGILISTEDQDTADAIWNLPSNICRVQLDRNTGKVIRNRITLARLRQIRIEPLFAGCNYNFSTLSK